MKGYVARVGEKLAAPNREIVNFGLVDSPERVYFVNRWNAQAPAHHCAVGLGHLGDKLDKLGKLLGIEVVRVC